MNNDIETILAQAMSSLEQVERQNIALKARLSKQASVVVPQAALVQDAVAALTKMGALNLEQVKQARTLLMSDPNAALRCISGIVNAQPNISKTASADSSDSLTCGHLVSNSPVKSERQHADGREVVLRILRTGKQ